MKKILLVDDNPEILEPNREHFERLGFAVTTADTGVKALAEVYIEHDRAAHSMGYLCVLENGRDPSHNPESVAGQCGITGFFGHIEFGCTGSA